MSDTPQGEGWWQASDFKWYPPEQHPNYVAPAPPAPPPPPPVDQWMPSPAQNYPGPPPVYVPQQQPSSAATNSQSTNGLAVASLVLAIVGAFLLFGIGALLAIIFGHVALGQIKRSAGQQGGKGLAIAGLVIGYIELAAIAAIIAIVALGAAATTSQYEAEKCDIDLRTLTTAVEAYNAENGAYPSSESTLVEAEFLDEESSYYDYTFDGTSPVYSLQAGSDCPEP